MTGLIGEDQLERMAELLEDVEHSARSNTKYRAFESYLASALHMPIDSFYTAYVSKAGNASVRFDQSSRPRQAHILIAIVEPPKNEHPMRTIEALERYCAEERPDAEFLAFYRQPHRGWQPYAAVYVAREETPVLLPFLESVKNLRIFPQMSMLTDLDPQPSAETLQFIVMHRGGRPRGVSYPYVVLRADDWRDAGDFDREPFQTMFSAYLHHSISERQYLGDVKILQRGQIGGQTALPSRPFEKLGEGYCSLGQSFSYYEAFRALPKVIRSKILRGLRDVVYNSSTRERFKNELGFQQSLVRTGRAERAFLDAPKLFADEVVRTPPGLSFTFETNVGGDQFDIGFTFNQSPELPDRINALIGYNGTGKTRLLANIALIATSDLKQRKSFSARYGRIRASKSIRFSSVIAVSYSAFDTFELPDAFWLSPEEKKLARKRLADKGDVFGYTYCGLRKRDLNQRAGAPRGLKTIDELTAEFERALDLARSHDRRLILHEVLMVMAREPSFGRMGIDPELAYQENTWLQRFGHFSTGHKIALNILVQVVAHSDPQSLVLIDEPESHLHPSLLAALIRALNIALRALESYAIIATHSPVVLQEIPRRYVHILERFGPDTSVVEPAIETFGENVGYLTTNVFHLDSSETDYHAVLKDLASRKSLDEIDELFDDQMSAQARAYVLSFMRAQGLL